MIARMTISTLTRGSGSSYMLQLRILHLLSSTLVTALTHIMFMCPRVTPRFILPFPLAKQQHILQFACSKAGFVLYNLDPNPSLAKSNPEAAKAALSKALELTEANVLITQEAGDDVNYVDLTTGVIPEIRIFDFGEGMPFITPRYPHCPYGFQHHRLGGDVSL